MSFVAVVIDEGEQQTRVFGSIESARQHCAAAMADGAERTEIYGVETEDARQAIAAYDQGQRSLIEVHTPRASKSQIEAAQHAEGWREVLKNLGLPEDSIIRMIS